MVDLNRKLKLHFTRELSSNPSEWDILPVSGEQISS